MNDEVSWHNIQVYYYDDERRDDLILDCLRPLFASLAPRPSFFLRHWLRGPHLRLRFHTTIDDFERVVLPTVKGQVGGWLAAHPSTVCLDEAALVAMHELLAAREREVGPLSPFYPDNSLQYLPCDRRIEVLGSEATASLLEEFYAATTELTFAMLGRIRHGTPRMNLALDLMWATAYCAGSITRGYVSYRAHAEVRIMTAPDPAARRSFFEQQYRLRAPALLERLQQVLDTLDHVSDHVPFVRDWLHAMNRLSSRAEPLLTAGELTLSVPEPGKWFNDEVTAHSAFHQALANNPAYLEMMRTSVWFHTWRVIINCTYLHLTRLGVRPFERSLLGFLLSKTIEERFGVSAIERVTAS
ncbi:MAG TPA: thiopeptide maturation pyridine synthase [Pseudonocardiaceae bacterium]|nr:thiopeptide maturation pyridine synthase [Pseudonocardiaceae bacterium]